MQRAYHSQLEILSKNRALMIRQGSVLSLKMRDFNETFTDAMPLIRLEKEGKEKENLSSDLCFCTGQFMFVCVTYDVWPLADFSDWYDLAQLHLENQSKTKHWLHFPNDFCVVKFDCNDKETSALSRIYLGKSKTWITDAAIGTHFQSIFKENGFPYPRLLWLAVSRFND